jgi:hypothetical protein
MDQVQYLNEKEVSSMTRRALTALRNDRFHRRGISYCKIGNGKSVRCKLAVVISFMDAGRIETFFIACDSNHEQGGALRQSNNNKYL